MRRFTLLGFCLLAITVAFTAFVVATESELEMRVPMGTLILEPPSSVEPKRSMVEFPHSRHFSEITCSKCHHMWTGTSLIQGCMTSGCHSLSTTEDKVSDVRYYKKAYHSQCIKCHKELKEKIETMESSMINIEKKIPSTGPTGCIECHPK